MLVELLCKTLNLFSLSRSIDGTQKQQGQSEYSNECEEVGGGF